MSNEARLEAALKQRFGQVKRTGNGWLRVACPTCTVHNAKKFKRYVSTTSRYTNCFICGTQMDVQDLTNGHYMPSYNAKDLAISKPKEVDPRAAEMPCHHYIPVNELEADHPAVKFLNKDYLYDLDLYYKDYGIVYVPVDGGKVFRSSAPYTTSAERLVFPVFFQGKMIGWQMRSIPGTFYGDRKDVIRYYHLFDKGSHLFNFEKARKFDEVVVVEGVKKALKFPNGVATWGAGISANQMQLIQGWDRIVMMLDGEDHNGTQQRAKDFVEGLRMAGKTAINIDLRKYSVTSPDDLPADTLQGIVKEEWCEQLE